MKYKDHDIYIKEDFRGWTDEEIEKNGNATAVFLWGLNVCKNCHEYEAGLDKPCIGKSKVLEVQDDRDGA